MAERRRHRNADERRIGAPRRLGLLVGRLLSPAARRRGFAEASLLADWATIVGPELAARCRPVRLSYPFGRHQAGVLHLHAPSAAALELQHQAPQILERINGYFGRLAVARLRLIHAPLPISRPKRPEPRAAPADPERLRRIAEQTEAITDPELREALAALGRAMVRQSGNNA